jgi:Zn-dependent peptidase ImmA (M78 family)
MDETLLFVEILDYEFRELGVKPEVIMVDKRTMKYLAEGWGYKFELYGLYIPDSKRMYILETLSPIQVFATIAHEYVHIWQEVNEYEKFGHMECEGFRQWQEYFKQAYNVDIVADNYE